MAVLIAGGLTAIVGAGATHARPTQAASNLVAKAEPTFRKAAAFDVSKPLREIAKEAARPAKGGTPRPELGPVVADSGHSRDGALQETAGPSVIPPPIANFEGLSNQDNFDVYGFRVNPPDPVGDVGPNHYVEMINIVFGVYSKTGTLLLGPLAIGDLWQDFPIDECTDPSGDPIVIYDQYQDRWILSQFTTRGLPPDPLNEFYNCVAISTTGDPTGSYYRYAFSTGFNFPDYPKYGIWRDMYLITTREFGQEDTSIYGIGIYGLERHKMIHGDPNARAVSVLLEDSEVPINLIGDGLLPPDPDGEARPHKRLPAPIVGTQDDGGPYGATFDALNIWEFDVRWGAEQATAELVTQLPVAQFDSIYPCFPTSRNCLPQPGALDTQKVDILSYRQRPTWRLAYRNFGNYEAMVTNQSVEAAPEHAGARWYEIRRKDGEYKLFQQGTYAPSDGVHRWMGSIAMDKNGNMALGYSVVNGVDVFPGIRYTGRLAGDPKGEMTQGEGEVIAGTGIQTTTNGRWGDYTSMNLDPLDDCTFWYVNQYYTLEGQQSSPAGWQTRIASFKLPGC
jgi:hypothetical protein